MSELFEKTVKGVMWSAIEHFSVKGVKFLTALIMARLLLPSDYGLLGLLGVFMSLSSVMIDGGVWQAILRKQDRTESDFTTMFYFNLGMSVLLYIILFIAAPYIANFFGYSELCLILRVVALDLIINAFVIVQKVHLYIELDFKKLSSITVIISILSGIVGISLAYMGYGVWALVWQGISYSIFYVILLGLFIRWYPKAPFSMQSFRSMFGFGSKLAISSIINIIYIDLANLAIGKYYSPSALGVYTRAQHFASFPASSITGVADRVTYPVFCKMGKNEEQLKKAFLHYLRIVAFIVFPTMMFLASISKPLIAVLLGSKWEYTSTLLPLFCFALIWYPISSINMSMIKVRGRSDIFLKTELTRKAMCIVFLFSSLFYGLEAVCYAAILSELLSILFTMYNTTKVLPVSIKEQIRFMLPAFTLSIFIGFSLQLVIRYIKDDLIALSCGTLVALLMYTLLPIVFRMNILSDIKLILKIRHHSS